MRVIAAYPTHADVIERTAGCLGETFCAATSCAIAGAVASNAVKIASEIEDNFLVRV